jgi:hypothetical protein
MWPRFKITPEENQYSSKYENPKSNKHIVLRRFYPGEINITPTIRQDQETFQISRRTRVFGLTASGDINLIEIQITDITGEQFTTDFIPIMNLLGGSIADPRAMEDFQAPPVGSPPSGGLFTGVTPIGPISYAPHIFEPCIVLAPNQTLSIQGRAIDPTMTGPLHVEMCLHVWEFPGMPGSPV